MKNLASFAFVLFIVVPLLLLAGYQFVPEVKAKGGTSLSDEFLFNSFLIVLGFAATSLLTGPIVSQASQLKEDREWKDARINARNRLAHLLWNALSDYKILLRCLEKDDPVASHFLDRTASWLREFFDAIDNEAPAFNAGMHRAVSNMRYEFLPLKKGLETARYLAHSERSQRFYLTGDAIQKLRSLFDLQPAFSGNSPPTDKAGRIILDMGVDLQVGAGATLLDVLAPVNVERLRREWDIFLSSCPKDGQEPAQIDWDISSDADTQKRLLGKYVKAQAPEPYLRDLVIKEQ